MAAGILEVAGPPCDFTPEYAAIMSVMNLSDYSQVKVCALCAPEYLRAVADAIAGVPAAAEAADAAAGDGGQPDGREPGLTEDCPLCGAAVDLADIPAHVDMHAAESPDPAVEGNQQAPVKPDPLTAKTVRSTHGHRTRKGAASGQPDPEADF